MKKFVPAGLAATALLIGAATTASPMKGAFNHAFGVAATSVTATDIETDAKALFAKVDIDRSGTLDADEFAGHALVLAELARFNRTVTIEGESEMQIRLPDGTPDQVSHTERGSIDAVARRAFHQFADNGEMSEEGFTAYRLSMMDKADTNRDGTLKSHELERFASAMARPAQPRG